MVRHLCLPDILMHIYDYASYSWNIDSDKHFLSVFEVAVFSHIMYLGPLGSVTPSIVHDFSPSNISASRTVLFPQIFGNACFLNLSRAELLIYCRVNS